MYSSQLSVKDEVVNKTAQKIYNAVKYGTCDYDSNFQVYVEFKDSDLEALLNKDYSKEFTQYRVDIYSKSYSTYADEYIDIDGKEVEYNQDSVVEDILYRHSDKYTAKYGGNKYREMVEEKLKELGFNELCEEKGVEVEFYFHNKRFEVDYDGENFRFFGYLTLEKNEKEE